MILAVNVLFGGVVDGVVVIFGHSFVGWVFVGAEDGAWLEGGADGGLDCASGGVWKDLGFGSAVALADAKDWGLWVGLASFVLF